MDVLWWWKNNDLHKFEVRKALEPSSWTGYKALPNFVRHISDGIREGLASVDASTPATACQSRTNDPPNLITFFICRIIQRVIFFFLSGEIIII